LLGRVTSVDYFGSFVVGPIAPVLGATVAAEIGPQAVFVIGGVVAFAFTVSALALVRPIRELT